MKTKKILGIVLIGGMLLSLGGVAIASDTVKQGVYATKSLFGHRGMGARFGNQDPAKIKEVLQTKLAGQVKSGALTQGKADQVIASYVKHAEDRQAEMAKIQAMTQEERQAYKSALKEPLPQLVADGVISQSEADAIAKVFPQKGPGRGRGDWGPQKGMRGFAVKEGMQKQLAELVSNKTLTQEKADQVVAYFTKLADEQKATMAKLQAMTQAERQAYMQQKNTERKDPLSQLVADKVLTQAEADAIAKAKQFKGPGFGRGKGPQGMRGLNSGAVKENMQKHLAELVSNKTLTQEKADQVVAYFTKLAGEQKAEMEKIQAMTPAERQTYMQQKSTARKDVLSQLVTDKVLSQQEADAIAKVMPGKGPGPGRGHKGMGGPGSKRGR